MDLGLLFYAMGLALWTVLLIIASIAHRRARVRFYKARSSK